MLNIILIVTITITLITTSVAAFYWRKCRIAIKEKYEPLYNGNLFGSSVNGYYMWFSKDDREVLSETLKKWANVTASESKWERLLGFFESSDAVKLQQFFEEIKQSIYHNTLVTRKLQQLLNENEERKPLFLQLTLPESEKSRFLECSGDCFHNSKGEPIGVILWFRDVSESTLQVHRLSFENEKLKQELRKYSNTLNFLPVPIWVRSGELSIMYCNFAYQKLMEQGSHKVQSAEVLELDQHAKKLAKSVKQTKLPQEEKRHIIAEGARRLYHMTEIPLPEEGFQLGFGCDITSKEEVEKELERHISAQSDLLESSASAMAIYGSDTRLKFFNQAFIKLWQLDESWLESEPTYAEVLDALRESRQLPEQANFLAFKQSHLRLFTDLIETHNEFFYLPNGMALRVIVIPHALGGLLFAYEDMTDRLILERSYNTLSSVQRATLDNLNEGVAVFAENGRLKLFNPTYARIGQLDPEVLGKEPHISVLLEMVKHLYNYGEDWEGFKQNIISMLVKRTAAYQRIERTDGSVIDRTCVPLPDGATLMTYVDVTDSTLVERSLRERNKALQDADRIKTEFLANVSYELRSPLTSIMGLSEALEKQYFGGLNVRQKEYVEGIYSSSQYLMSLINDILDLASIEAGYMKLQVEKFDIYSALSSVLPLIKERVKESGLHFNFECADNIGSMLGDAIRIKQVVFKLLSNAIQFTEREGKVVLRTEAVNDDLFVITIEDTGVGIAFEEQQMIFNKFYKADYSKAKMGKSGAGLGLSVVKSFIELHGGRVELDSTIGKGTIVRCYLQYENSELLRISSHQKVEAR